MERNSWATYQDISDALPTVNAGSTPARLDQPPTTARISPHELGPYHERSERFRFFARIVETLRALPRGSKDLVCSERINILLVFVPIGITVGLLEVDPIVDFVLNALAIIPVRLKTSPRDQRSSVLLILCSWQLLSALQQKMLRVILEIRSELCSTSQWAIQPS